ncbi:MAG: hypothetical protein OXG64_07325 [Chloroflexi bacterium]|nr:hypothetical protein [Chloroflexota bacterium]
MVENTAETLSLWFGTLPDGIAAGQPAHYVLVISDAPGGYSAAAAADATPADGFRRAGAQAIQPLASAADIDSAMDAEPAVPDVIPLRRYSE